MELFNVILTKSELRDLIMIILVSTSPIFSFHPNTLYAAPANATRSDNATTQTIAKDNNNTSTTPSVILLSPVPLNRTNVDNNTLSSTTSESSNGNNANPNAPIHDTGSNRGTHHTHDGASSINQHKNSSNKSHDVVHKILNKIKHKLKVGDIPFP